MPASTSSSRQGSRRQSITAEPQSSVMPGSTASSRQGSRRQSIVTPSLPPSQTSPRSTISAGTEQLAGHTKRVNLNSKLRQLHPRAPAGKKGKPKTVLTNHFPITAQDMPESIFRFDVTIRKAAPGSPETLGRVKRRVFELLLKDQKFSKTFTDYEKILISFKSLDITKDYQVVYYEPEEGQAPAGPNQIIYNVKLTLAYPPLPTQALKELIQDPSRSFLRANEYEQALNIILLKHASQHEDLTTAARGTKVFSLKGRTARQVLGQGLDVYRGCNFSLRILQGGPCLRLNVTHGVMYDENWVDLVIAKWKPPQTPKSLEHKIAMLAEFLCSVRVKGIFGDTHRVKPISGIASTDQKLLSASELSFYCDTIPTTGQKIQRSISVHDYFKVAYPGIEFRNPPEIVLNVGSGGKKVWWPANLCVIQPGQPHRRRLPHPEQAQAMIKFACRRPVVNIQTIESESLNMLGIKRLSPPAPFSDPSALPFRVRLNMVTVPARRIDSPSILFRGIDKVSPQESATGRWNLKGRKFRDPGRIVPYTVLDFSKQGEGSITNLDQFVNMLGPEMSRYLSVPEAKTKPTRVENVLPNQVYPITDEKGWLTRLLRHCLKHSVEYCFIIISDRSWYSTIKTVADAIGMHTTLMVRKPGKLARSSLGEICNLLLKFNMKLGGRNWVVDVQKYAIMRGREAIFIGADVVHPPPGAKKKSPSVAAVVASTGPIPVQFPGTIALQHNPDGSKGAAEMILTLHVMVASRLELYAKRNNGRLPGLVFFYRDGVSDSQLLAVLHQEVPRIEDAIKLVYDKYRQPYPLLSVHSTQKRHIVRFYQPKIQKDSDFDDNGNPLPGFMMREKIVSSAYDDYFAIHHRTLQGTGVPVHHLRIYDETNADVDELQELTHALAFIFERSVTSVSIPAPAKYADLLCERAKHRLADVYFPGPGGFEETYDQATATFHGQQSVAEKLQDTMYYI